METDAQKEISGMVAPVLRREEAPGDAPDFLLQLQLKIARHADKLAALAAAVADPATDLAVWRKAECEFLSHLDATSFAPRPPEHGTKAGAGASLPNLLV